MSAVFGVIPPFRATRRSALARLAAVLIVLLLAVGPQARAADVDVLLRTGDVLTIGLPGEAALSKDFQLDRQGQIQLPEVGSVTLTGRTIAQAKEDVRGRLGKAYRDLGRLSVVLKERRLLITVLGYVKTPGPVELSGDATVQTAIAAAGGLVQGAQLDRIKVRRDKIELTFDYKRYLDSGDTAILPDLRPLDIVFVPASPRTGNVQIDFDGRTLAEAGDGAEDRSAVKVFGEVNKPGVFAFRPGLNIVDMVMRAGGVTRYASVEQIRLISRGAPVLFNLQAYLDTGDVRRLPELSPGATVFVPKQVEEIRQGAHTVYVIGEVARPGAFETKPEANFVEILANSGGPTRFADTKRLRILRGGGEVETVDLSAHMEGKGGKLPSVSPGDAILVPEKMDTAEPSWLKVPPTRAVQMIGAVTKPGRFEWSDEMSILDLIAQAGGPTARADIANIQILKSDKDRTNPIRFDLAAFLAKGGAVASLPAIRAGTVVMVPELPQDPADNKAQWTRQAPERSIYVMGQVGAPGRYAFNASLAFLDIIAAANGPTNSADIRNIRVSHRNAKGSRVTKVNLARYFETGDDSILPKVRPGDVIFVPDRNKEWLDDSKEATVRVLGAVGKPGRYRFSGDLTLLDLLAESGGPTNDALQSKIIVINFSADGEQARVFDLIGFAKTGDIRKLPVVRAGDTVYVPNNSQSDWKIFMDGVRDVLPLASVIALMGAL